MRVACFILEDAVFANCLMSFGDHGLTAVRYTNELSLLRALRSEPIDVVLVDVGADAALEALVFACIQRAAVARVPFVLQTVDRLPHRIALALRAGIADVVARGTEPVELVARLMVAARRGSQGDSTATLSCASFMLDRINGSITDRAMPVDLTPREFALAWLLFSNEGQCVSRREISLAVWGVESEISSRTMEQHIHQLRKKLGLGPERGVSVRAVYGSGYLLSVHARAVPAARGEAAGSSRKAAGSGRQFARVAPKLTSRFASGSNVHPVQAARIDWMLAHPAGAV
jgi:two-component system, OmpR family, response regulator QseB